VLGIEWLDSGPAERELNLGARIEHLSGVAAVADGVVLIYDLATFLSVPEARLLDVALAQRASESRS
jgi:hypothetical protein